jgi:hypothetical protein
VVMFLDTCSSGAAGGRTFASRRTRASAVDDLFLERLTRSRGRAIITAARPSEVSVGLPELFQGRLYADARPELMRAIALSPEEATLRLLLGHVCDRTGLAQLAANEFDEAEALAAPRRQRV